MQSRPTPYTEQRQSSRQVMANIQYVAEQAAQLLLRQFREAHPWWQDDYLPLDQLVEWLDLNVEVFHAESHARGTYGFVDPDESEHLIWLLQSLPQTIRRFTLSHELGHVVLHCQHTPQLADLLRPIQPLLAATSNTQTPRMSDDDPCQDKDVDDDGASREEQAQDRLGIGQSYDPRSLREQAANMFAAELLMPLEHVRSLYLDKQVHPAMLHERFGVSQSAMLNRLAHLLQPVAAPNETFIMNREPTETISTTHKSYDEFQHAAITAPTPALIVAGPGSGKTSTLIGRVAHLVETLHVPPQHILALTFSRKAAEEMEERLLALLPTALPKVCTFHAFCADILRQYGELVGLRPDFSLLDDAESYTMLQQQSHALNLQHYQRLQSPTAYFPDLLKAISRAKDELVTPERYMREAQRMAQFAGDDEQLREQAERASEVAHVYTLYQQALTQRGDTDFGGLLMLTIQLFEEHPNIAHVQHTLYQHILVDEFQDVNHASGVLLRVVAGEARRVWVVGDTNQAIYRFRGASPANLSRFTEDFPGAVILPLSRNYRSRPDLVKIAEAFRCKQLELGEEPGKNEAVRLTLDDTSVTIAHATNETSELQGIVQDIQRRHAQGQAYRDMVILCRTRAQAQKISRALVSMEVPVKEPGSLLEQEHIKNVLTALLLLTDASGSGILRLPQEYAFSRNDLETLFQEAHKRRVPPMQLIENGEAPINMNVTGRHALLSLSALIHRLYENSRVWSLLAQYMFIETTTIRGILDSQESKAYLADYDALIQLARHYDAQQERIAQPRPSPGEQARGFLEYLRLLRLLRQEGTMRRSEQEDDEQLASDTLHVMTVHASKGLEFPVVYMPGLTTQRFPSTMHANPVPLPPGITRQENSAYTMQVQEESARQAHDSGESCLFYVGVTRARDALILSYSDRYGKKNYKPSPYLEALRAGLPEEHVRRAEWNFDIGAAFVDEDEESVSQNTIESITERLNDGFIRAMSTQTLRVTDVEAYHRCPRQYAYSRLYHFANEQNGYQLFHRATQQVIEQLHRSYKQQEQDTAGEVDVQSLYMQHWQQLGGHLLPFAPLYEQHAQHVLAETQRALQSQTHEETLHSTCDIEIAGHTVQVMIDRVDMQPLTSSPTTAESSRHAATPTASTMPITFKRTRFGKRKDKPEAEMRDLFYTLAYRKEYPDQTVHLQHHNLSTGETVKLSMTPKKEQKLQSEVERAITGITQRKYPAKPSEPSECLTCPFFFICPI